MFWELIAFIIVLSFYMEYRYSRGSNLEKSFSYTYVHVHTDTHTYKNQKEFQHNLSLKNLNRFLYHLCILLQDFPISILTLKHL